MSPINKQEILSKWSVLLDVAYQLRDRIADEHDLINYDEDENDSIRLQEIVNICYQLEDWITSGHTILKKRGYRPELDT